MHSPRKSFSVIEEYHALLSIHSAKLLWYKSAITHVLCVYLDPL